MIRSFHELFLLCLVAQRPSRWPNPIQNFIIVTSLGAAQLQSQKVQVDTKQSSNDNRFLLCFPAYSALQMITLQIFHLKNQLTTHFLFFFSKPFNSWNSKKNRKKTTVVMTDGATLFSKAMHSETMTLDVAFMLWSVWHVTRDICLINWRLKGIIFV